MTDNGSGAGAGGCGGDDRQGRRRTGAGNLHRQGLERRGGFNIVYRLAHLHPPFDPLRPDPRFQALLRRMNFPETAAPS